MSEWQSIETAPKNKRFLGFRPAVKGEFDHWIISVCKYRKSLSDKLLIYSEADYEGLPYFDWTHWMPLPEPPK